MTWLQPIEVDFVGPGGLPGKVSVVYDEDAESPLENDDGRVTQFALFHRRYSLPNDTSLHTSDFDGWEAMQAEILRLHPNAVVSDVLGYDHGGLALSTKYGYPFTDRWDAGQLGFAFVTPARWREVGLKCGRGWRAKARADIDRTVKLCSEYLQGCCYGWKVECGGDEVESCWGYVGRCGEESGLLDDVRGCMPEAHDALVKAL